MAARDDAGRADGAIEAAVARPREVVKDRPTRFLPLVEDMPQSGRFPSWKDGAGNEGRTRDIPLARTEGASGMFRDGCGSMF
jgi:hypothetical protein